jgi:molybdenum cofactor cytidylyltransferase
MGSPKALLDAGDGQTFLGCIAGRLRAAGLRRILAVVAPGAGPIVTAAEQARISVVVNADPSLGPISSIRTALDTIEPEGFAALLFWPVDMPCVSLESVRRVLDAWRPEGPPIVLPTHGGRRGHPVIAAEPVWADLRSALADAGARAVVRKNPDRVLEVEVDDDGVLLDIDTTRAYRRLRFGR